jgi:hypothetical protein
MLFDMTYSLIVYRLELAAIDGNARRREKPHLTAQFDEAVRLLSIMF